MSDQITITLPDGSAREYAAGTTAGDVARSIGKRLAKAAVAATVDGAEFDLERPLPDGAGVAIITDDTPDGRHVLRHSTAHVMAQAVTQLFPGAKYSIGPAIENGFYYDFELPGGRTFSDDDLGAIEARMREIIAADQPFTRSEVSADEALDAVRRPALQGRDHRAGQGRRATSADELDSGEVAAGGTISVYRNTPEFLDLCKGPHVPTTARLGHFKLQKVAGAYWRGNEKGPMLQRIYGTAWESDAALEAHLEMLVEAEKRDHRRLATDLDLLSFPSELGGGLAVWHPKGAIVRKLMEDYSRQRHEDGGYEFVFTPHLTKQQLFETSGHLDWYADGMYPPMEMDNGTYYMKPMNCPMHCLIFRSRQRSYRELPLRLFELGTVYRYERAGTLHGLMRIRGFTQDDSHIYCTPEQAADEIASLLDFVLSVLRAFGFDDFTFNLSTKDPHKYVGTDEGWDDGDGGAARRPRAPRPRVRDQGGRRRVLRAEDRHRRARRHRPQLAAVDDPVRLQPPGALRPRVRRRRQRPAPPDHAAPRPVRVGRALLRRAARALRRQPADVAGAGAGARAARRHGPRGVRRQGRRPAAGDRRPRRRRSAPTSSSASASAPPSWRSCRTSSSSATTTSPTRRSASTGGGATSPSAASTSPRFVEMLAEEIELGTTAALQA